MAAKGAFFERAFAHNPLTLPFHTNILLGVTPPYHGIHDNLKFIVSGEFLTLAEHLKTNGYNTAAFVGPFPLDSRFGPVHGIFWDMPMRHKNQGIKLWRYMNRLYLWMTNILKLSLI